MAQGTLCRGRAVGLQVRAWSVGGGLNKSVHHGDNWDYYMADRGISLLIKSLAKYSVSLQTTRDVCKMSAYGLFRV